jgi:catechol 2,3-dioxygenase-like lactoylglutathione lyase family enzyme
MPGEAGSYERWRDVLCIGEVATDNLEEARQYFTEVFGMRADGKEVDLKIQQLFDEACNHWIDGESVNTRVAVPIELILAITLRKGFNRKTGRQKKSPYRRHNLESAVRWAKRRAAELRQGGMGIGPAKEQAIREAEQQYGRRVGQFYGTNASTIRDNWSKIV